MCSTASAIGLGSFSNPDDDGDQSTSLGFSCQLVAFRFGDSWRHPFPRVCSGFSLTKDPGQKATFYHQCADSSLASYIFWVFWKLLNVFCMRSSPSQLVSQICLSQVWLQTELDDTKSYFQLIIKITISEKWRIAKLRRKKGKFALKYGQRRRKHFKATAPPTRNWAPKTQKEARARMRLQL